LIVQVVDARNPLLFYCPDLDTYAGEHTPARGTLLVVNKADMLSDGQRDAWAATFQQRGQNFVFWSASQALQELESLEISGTADDLHHLSVDGSRGECDSEDQERVTEDGHSDTEHDDHSDDVNYDLENGEGAPEDDETDDDEVVPVSTSKV